MKMYTVMTIVRDSLACSGMMRANLAGRNAVPDKADLRAIVAMVITRISHRRCKITAMCFKNAFVCKSWSQFLNNPGKERDSERAGKNKMRENLKNLVYLRRSATDVENGMHGMQLRIGRSNS